MTKQILQINFNFNVSKSELVKGFTPLATPIANTPGLMWKIWSVNEEKKEFGGIYLFENESSVEKFLAGEIVAGVKAHPALSNISVKQFGIAEDLTKVTRGPIELVQATA